MIPTRVKSIILKKFRNHEAARLNLSENDKIIGIIDSNGTGKTGILEAISLLCPGHGLRGENAKDLIKHGSEDGFFVGIEIMVGSDITQKIEITYINGRKKVTINDKTAQSHADMKNILGVVWITPELQVDISLNMSSRRKFFDKMVANFDITHAENVHNYDNLIKERMKILEAGKSISNNRWLDSIEKQISELSISIMQARLKVVSQIIKHAQDLMLNVDFSISCNATSLFLQHGNVADAFIASELLKNREIDSRSGRTSFGCHRYDFVITYTPKQMEISLCSSGEKKYLIMSFLLAIVQGIILTKSHTPIVLIDEFTSFIDANFRSILVEKLMQLDCQVWLTGTEIPSINRELKIYKISDITI